MLILTSLDESCGNDDVMLASGEILLTSSGEDGSLDNLTLTCAARTIAESGVTPYSTTVNNIVKAFRLVWYTPISVLGVSLNSFVIYLVIKNKKLQTLSFVIALQVMILNILLSVYVFTIVLTTLAGRWVLGTYACAALGFLSFTSVLILTTTMFVFVVDRFLSVFTPYFYPRHKIKIAISLSVISWVVNIAFNICYFPGILDCYGFADGANVCGFLQSCDAACIIHNGVYLAVVTLPSIIVPLVMFTVLYCKARSLHKSEVTAQGDGSELHSRERRATITFFLLFITLFAVTVPMIIFDVVVDSSLPSNQPLPPVFYILQIVKGAVLSLLILMDAIVVMCHRDIKDALSEMRSNLMKKLCTR